MPTPSSQPLQESVESISVKNPAAVVVLVVCIAIGLTAFGVFASKNDAVFQAAQQVKAQQRAEERQQQQEQNRQKQEEYQRQLQLQRQQQQNSRAVPPSTIRPTGFCIGNGSPSSFGDPGMQCCPGLQVINNYCSLPAGTIVTKNPCTDSDGGVTPNTWGTVSGGSYGTINYNHGAFADYCNQGKVVEYYCSGDTVLFSQIACPQGSLCQYGACTPFQNNQQNGSPAFACIPLNGNLYNGGSCCPDLIEYGLRCNDPLDAYIKVISPSTGTILEIDKPITITWDSIGFTSKNVSIALSNVKSRETFYINRLTPNTGSYLWNVDKVTLAPVHEIIREEQQIQPGEYSLFLTALDLTSQVKMHDPIKQIQPIVLGGMLGTITIR